MSRVAVFAALGLLMGSSQAEAACHHFSIWHYTTPQHCRGTAVASVPRRAPVRVAVIPIQPSAPVAPQESAPIGDVPVLPELDGRDAATREHDQAVAKYHDLINAEMELLRLQEQH